MCQQEDERNVSAEGISTHVSLGRRFRDREAHPGHSVGPHVPPSPGVFPEVAGKRMVPNEFSARVNQKIGGKQSKNSLCD